MSQPWTPPPPPGTETKVPNNMVLGIIATVISLIFCCLPHGAISLIFATQVDKKAAAGDVAGALDASKKARLAAMISIAVAIVGFVLAFAFGIVAGVMSSLSNV